MCLAMPGKVVKLLEDNFAMVNFLGVEKRVVVDLLNDITVGDYVIVHAGYALNKLEEKVALESLECFKDLYGIS